VNWQSPKRLTDWWEFNPCVAVSGSNVYVAYGDFMGSMWRSICFIKSTDGGDSWTEEEDISSVWSDEEAYDPAIAVNSSYVFVVFDKDYGDYEIILKRSPL